ncbi:MAG: S8 family serine peptidase [Gemmatimonadaceae bacterium]
MFARFSIAPTLGAIPRDVRVLLHAIALAAAFTGCSSDDHTTGTLTAPPQRLSSFSNAAALDTGSYIVLLKDRQPDLPSVAHTLSARGGGREKYVYDKLQGFSISGLPAAALKGLQQDARVRSIERDARMTLSGDQILPAGGWTSPLWALDRVDTYGAPSLDAHFLYSNAGNGVHIYVIDSGVRGGHTEFTGRIGIGACFVTFSSGCSPTIDAAGHGTAVASIAAGTVHGIAKLATIHPVRVTDDGNNVYCSDVVAGLNWVGSHTIAPAVANLSINGGPPDYSSCFAIRDAIDMLVALNVLVFKSAGNFNRDAFDDRSNRSLGSVVVGATRASDVRSDFSNWGSTVTLMAPGENMETATSATNTSLAIQSGTSFSAPLAAGAAAAILSANPALTAATLKSALLNGASPVAIGNGLGVANRLMFSRISPQMAITASLSGPMSVRSRVTCDYTATATGAPGPFTYAWSVNGAPAGTNTPTFSFTNSGSSYAIGVTIAAPGAVSGSRSISVSVSASASACGVV